MQPTLAPETPRIRANAICQTAASKSGFTTEQARLALGAISNMYYLYALDQSIPPDAGRLGSLSIRGLVSDRIASKEAVIREITRAVPAFDITSAHRILNGLAAAVDEILTIHPGVHLEGFGTLRTIDSGYELTIELPLTKYLRAST